MAYPPTLPPNTRTDETVAAGNHASDHNLVANALAAIVEVLGPFPQGDDYDDLTALLADTALRRVGRVDVANIDFSAMAAHTTAEQAITVPGAVFGDVVAVGVSEALEAGLMVCGVVTDVDTVAIRLANVTAGSINPANRDYTVLVTR